jgi:hypothetical protein
MVVLPGGLVVPAAPGLAAVHADDAPLVHAGEQAPGVAPVNPQQLEVVAARRARDRLEGAAAVE